ncbi:MAG: lytic transglycosylase domain-containing protein [Permianibacter sp.]
MSPSMALSPSSKPLWPGKHRPLSLWQRICRSVLAAALLLAVPVLTAPVEAAQQERPSDEVRALIKKAMHEKHDFADKYEAQVWLVDMAGRLEKRAPKIPAAERLHVLRRVHAIATEFGLNPQLVLAVIDVESRFDRFAVSKAGARGLMQVMPFWREEIGEPTDNLFDVDTNLRYGCAILKIYLAREKERLAPALARYNGSYGQGWYPSLVMNAFYNHWFVMQDRRTVMTASGQNVAAPLATTTAASAAGARQH